MPARAPSDVVLAPDSTEVPPTEEEKAESARGITGQSEGRHAY